MQAVMIVVFQNEALNSTLYTRNKEFEPVIFGFQECVIAWT